MKIFTNRPYDTSDQEYEFDMIEWASQYAFARYDGTLHEPNGRAAANDFAVRLKIAGLIK